MERDAVVAITVENGARAGVGYGVLGAGPVTWPGPDVAPPAATGTGATGTGADQRRAEEDAALVQRSRVDAEAFGVLYDRYCDAIYRYVYRRLRSHESAEDVTAEVFLKALRAIDTYRPAIAPFAAWLYRIAANAVVDHARARHITVSLDAAAQTPDTGPAVDDQAVDRVEAGRVWAAVDALSPAQRTAVTLRYEQDLPIGAIAARMGRSEGAVKLLLNRGLTAVRTALPSTTDSAEDRP